MLNNGYLIGNLGKSLVKELVKSGDLTYAEAQNQHEKDQLDAFKKEINKSKVSQHSLMYSLLFDKVYLDETSIGGITLFSDHEDPEQIEYRQIFEDSSERLGNHLHMTNATLNYHTPYTNPLSTPGMLSNGYENSSAERAKLFNTFEPYVWQRMKTLGKERINRDMLGYIIEKLTIHPHMLSSVRSDEDNFDLTSLKEIFTPFSKDYSLDLDTLEYFRSTIYMLDVKASVALAHVREAQRLDAALPLLGLTSRINNRYQDTTYIKSLGKHEDIVTSVKVFLDEIEFLPKIESYSDIVKLKEKSAFTDFRNVLSQWVVAFQSGNAELEQKLRKDIKLANQSLKKAHRCERVGKICTYVGVPLLALDLLLLPVFGAPVTITGFGMQAYADQMKSKNKWLLIGRDA
ncbi:hypothetical protein CXF86_19375 [Shewanella sp. GutCb]|uniref:hypothetical protein n=1 Tax=Shewanella sp. GutCb TaxID=2058315 RepID=UPI000C7C1051|nr:hypothetical protein [Shewanella sp. GutCb]PKG73103.1 hypothetical protein CXF86_19375 [Shewanella sp. GutCb]